MILKFSIKSALTIGVVMAQGQENLTGFDLALSAVGGNASRLARLAGVSPQAVAQWKRTGYIPLVRVFHLSKVLGIPKSKLNPLFARERA